MTKPFTSARLTEALKAPGAGVTAPIQQATLASPAQASLIDDEAVASMETVGQRSGRDVVAKVWKLFLTQAPNAVAKLETLASEANLPDAAKQAHFLKSMSLSSGAARLAALCETIEHEGKAQDSAALGHVASIRPLVDETCAIIAKRLANRASAAAEAS